MGEHEEKIEIMRKYLTDMSTGFYCHIGGEVPSKKINNALKTFAQGMDSDTIIGFYDTTSFGSGKNGYIFTDDKMYYVEMFEKPKKLWYDDIKQIRMLNSSKKDSDRELAIDFLDGSSLYIEGGLIKKTPLKNFLNEMKNLFAKKTLQTIIYLPHFMSWAVVASIFSLFLSPSSTGMINGLLRDIGILGPDDKNIYFLANKAWWRPIFYFINIWKETGWGTIIFLATLSGINPELYEAADIDGASRMQKIRFVTLPALTNTIITVLILNLAKVLNMFEPVFVLYNSAVYDKSDVIATYTAEL